MRSIGSVLGESRCAPLGRALAVVVALMAVCSCSSGPSQRQMKMIIRGVVCDPEHATLIAEGTNESSIDSFDDLRRVELYRTPGGHHYFAQNEVGYDMDVELLSRTDAMQLYDALPDHHLEFTQAFAD